MSAYQPTGDRPLDEDLIIFSGRANPQLAEKICEYLDLPLGRLKVENFPDQEIGCRVADNVRGRDVFVVQPTCPPVNDHLMELLIIIDCLKRASAARITAVIPYFGYARQDRKEAGRVPVTAKLVANLIVQAGANRVLTMDLHSPQIQGFFDVPVDHLHAVPVINAFFHEMGLSGDDIVVVSPDEGSIKRAVAHAQQLGGTLAIIDKRRVGNNTSAANLIGGPVTGKVALVFDDMISTASSITGAAQKVRDAGAAKVFLAATHGVFCGPAYKLIADAPVDGVLVTNTIPIKEEGKPETIIVRSVAGLFGEAIRRIHLNESVSGLFDPECWKSNPPWLRV